MHCKALAVLSNCLEDTESLDDIRNTGGLDKLLGFVTEQTLIPEVQAHTARAIARAAKNGMSSVVRHHFLSRISSSPDVLT